MKVPASLYTFLLFNFRFCFSNMANFHPVNKNCTNCRNVQRDIQLMKKIEIIKLEIMRRLNISAQKDAGEDRSVKETIPRPEPETVSGNYESRGADILSYSEPADNFTDDNIVQFRLANRTAVGRRLYVSSANLLVRVKYKRRKKRHNNKSNNKNNNINKNKRSERDLQSKKRDKRYRKNSKSKAVDLELYTVSDNGRPDQVITSVTSKLKKTKWLKLSLPRKVVQTALDSRNNTLQMYIKCKGCGKRAHIILVHKKRKRKRNKPAKLTRRLHKRRPRLITRVTQLDTKNEAEVDTPEKDYSGKRGHDRVQGQGQGKHQNLGHGHRRQTRLLLS